MAVRLPLIFFVLYFFVFVLGGLSSSAPFLVKIEWSYQGTTQPTIQCGFFIGDRSDSNWVFHWNWCESNAISGSENSCDDLRMSWLISCVLWTLHLPVILAIVPSLFLKPGAAYVLSPIGFLLHLCGGFCFVFRVPPMFREVLQFSGPTTGVSWSLGWAGGIAIASVCVHFCVAVMLAFFHRRLLGLDKELERVMGEGILTQPQMASLSATEKDTDDVDEPVLHPTSDGEIDCAVRVSERIQMEPFDEVRLRRRGSSPRDGYDQRSRDDRVNNRTESRSSFDSRRRADMASSRSSYYRDPYNFNFRDDGRSGVNQTPHRDDYVETHRRPSRRRRHHDFN